MYTEKFHKKPGQNFPDHFRIIPNAMFPESACLKTNFGTNLEFFVPAVAEKFLGEGSQFRWFFAIPAIHALTKFFITFDGFNRFSRMITYFIGNDMTVFILHLLLQRLFKFVFTFLTGFNGCHGAGHNHFYRCWTSTSVRSRQ